MSDEVTILGMDAVFANLDAHLIRQTNRANKAIHLAGLTARGVAKKNCPVGTPESTGIKNYHGGRLRQSIMVDNSTFLESTVGTNVYYAIFVHEGTRKMRGRPFLRQGFDAGWKQLEDSGYGGSIE